MTEMYPRVSQLGRDLGGTFILLVQFKDHNITQQKKLQIHQ